MATPVLRPEVAGGLIGKAVADSFKGVEGATERVAMLESDLTIAANQGDTKAKAALVKAGELSEKLMQQFMATQG